MATKPLSQLRTGTTWTARPWASSVAARAAPLAWSATPEPVECLGRLGRLGCGALRAGQMAIEIVSFPSKTDDWLVVTGTCLM